MTTPRTTAEARDALNEALGIAYDLTRPEPKMSGPHYRTIGPVTAQRVHEAIVEAIALAAAEAPGRVAEECVLQTPWCETHATYHPFPAPAPTPSEPVARCGAYGQDHSNGCPASDTYPLDGES